MEYRELRNGVKIPIVGIGTFQLKGECTKEVILHALQCGIRLIDTANAYLNEKEIGEALKIAQRDYGIQREEIFIISKIWPTMYTDDQVVEKSLERLGVSYIDMMLVHQPVGEYTYAYEQLENAYHKGLVKSIGVSNYTDTQLDELLKWCDVKPHAIQAETHPYCYRECQKEYYESHGIQMIGWYPLGHANEELLDEAVLQSIAKKYHKTVEQVIIRWHIQKGMITIPGTKNTVHMQDNINVFDFDLSPNELQSIDTLSRNKHFYQATDTLLNKHLHLHLPYENK